MGRRKRLSEEGLEEEAFPGRVASNLFKAGNKMKQDLRELEKESPDANHPIPFSAHLSITQLFQIERMASQGMNLQQISIRLRIPNDTFTQIIRNNPKVREAYESGAARGVDDITGALSTAAKHGDVGAMRYYLDRLGGPQFKPPAHNPAVVILPTTSATVDLGAVEDAFAMQRKLLDDWDDAHTIEYKETPPDESPSGVEVGTGKKTSEE